MTFRKSLLFSGFMHALLILYLFLPKYDLNLDIDLKQGISSLSININKSKKSEEANEDETEAGLPREFNILISPKGFFDIAVADRDKKKENEKRDNKDKNDISMISKRTIGALYKKAAYLSRNRPPEYPYLARRMGYQGRVTLEIQVLPTGATGNVRVVKSSGFDLLDRSAVKAAKKWIFFNKDEFSIPGPVIITKAIEFIIQGSTTTAAR